MRATPNVDGHMVAGSSSRLMLEILNHRLDTIFDGLWQRNPRLWPIHHNLWGGAHGHGNHRGAAGHRFGHD